MSPPYLTRNPNKPGEPNGFVFWQKFATDLQTLADRRTHSDDFMARLVKIEAKERVAAKCAQQHALSRMHAVRMTQERAPSSPPAECTDALTTAWAHTLCALR